MHTAADGERHDPDRPDGRDNGDRIGPGDGGGAGRRRNGDDTAVEVFLRGTAILFTIPGFILLASAGGFGALARDAGLSLGNAVLMMGALFALPAQVVMVDQLARGGSLLGAAVAVALIGVRLLPMTVVLAPYLGGSRASSPLKLLAVHAVAITAWIEGLRRLPDLPERLRLPYFGGLGVGLVTASLLGTVAGYELAAQLPPPLAAALLFMTPIYFILSLLATAARASDGLAIGFGSVLGPLAFALAPGFDLLITGLVAGTAAHLVARRWRATVRGDGDPDSDGGEALI